MRREGVAIAVLLLMVGSAVAGYVANGSVFNSSEGRTTSIPTTQGSAETTTVTSVSTVDVVSTATFVEGSGQLGPWNDTASRYPGAYPPSSCVTAVGYIYCVGGDGNATYWARVSPGSVGQWKPGTPYPVPIGSEGCVTIGSEIYCIGGISQGPGNQTSDRLGRTADAYYAPLSSSGIGKWTETTPYPYIAASPRCMVSSSYVYCLEAGLNGTGYTGIPEAYYAPLSAAGIGSWDKTDATPTMTAGCSAIGGFGYCFGGVQCPPEGGDCYSPTYSAPLTPSGIGKWNSTTELPTAGYANYVAAGPYIYYLSVPLFYVYVSNGTVGPWETTTNFPDGNPAPCASYAGYLYCGDYSDDGFYVAQVSAPNPSAFVLLDPPPYPRAQYLAPAFSRNGGCGVSIGGKFSGAPCFSRNIDDAVIFDCAVAAATASGCQTMVVSPTNSSYNYNATIWYPRYSASYPDTNCELLATFGGTPAIHAWCVSISPDSFIITQQLMLQSG